ncbi:MULTISPECIES: hypothetical protein [Paenibacillus]|uniref:hypothetical protein n=1 Tax=Paenibacillus TaxID=44249 RepID=UPI002FE149B7
MKEAKTELDRLVSGLPPLLREEALRMIGEGDFISFLGVADSEEDWVNNELTEEGAKGPITEGKVREVFDILRASEVWGPDREGKISDPPPSPFGERLVLFLPPGLPAEALLKACLPKGVAFRQAGAAARGKAAEPEAEEAAEEAAMAAESREAIALDMAGLPPERIREGLARIAAALAEFTARSGD